MDKKQPPKQTPTAFGVSGWTEEELEKLGKLIEAHGTDRSKLIRKLVREAPMPDEKKDGAIWD